MNYVKALQICNAVDDDVTLQREIITEKFDATAVCRQLLRQKLKKASPLPPSTRLNFPEYSGGCFKFDHRLLLITSA